MELAIDEAILNIKNGGGPFGAVVVKNGEVIACCGNRVTQDNDPTAHAEVLAIREATKKLNSWDLSDCEIYSSCEPCPMCLSAIYWAHIKTIFYGNTKEDARSVGFDDNFIYDEIALDKNNRKIKAIPFLREEAIISFELWDKNENKTKY